MVQTADEIKVRRVYKDTMFRMLFGAPEYIDNLRLLINVLYDKTYTERDNDRIEITTMEDVIFANVKNDVKTGRKLTPLQRSKTDPLTAYFSSLCSFMR